MKTKKQKVQSNSIPRQNSGLTDIEYAQELISKHFSELGKKSWAKRKAKLLKPN